MTNNEMLTTYFTVQQTQIRYQQLRNTYFIAGKQLTGFLLKIKYTK